jgi:hypothetical protein
LGIKITQANIFVRLNQGSDCSNKSIVGLIIETRKHIGNNIILLKRLAYSSHLIREVFDMVEINLRGLVLFVSLV